MSPTGAPSVPAPQPDAAKRLARLRAHAILDTPPEAAFDEIARLAARISGASMAAVTLVAESRQWFKARVGIAEPETDIARSFCAVTVQGRDTLVVEDASTHPIFATYPNVVGEDHVRFYVGVPLVETSGTVLGTLCVADTVTRTVTPEQVMALEALARAVTARMELRLAGLTLAAAAANRQELIDLLAHEVSNAITPVVGLATMLTEEDGASGPDVQDSLRVIARGLTRAGALAHDIVDLSRIEGDRLRVTLEPIPVSTLLDETRAAMGDTASRAGVTLLPAAALDATLVVRADPARVMQVLANLVANALKFTPPGGTVTLSATRTADGRVAVHVTDTGQGMTAEQSTRLFTRFGQMGHVAQNRDRGTGLGLYISKQIVEAHGGTMSAASDGPGRGTVLTFTLPSA